MSYQQKIEILENLIRVANERNNRGYGKTRNLALFAKKVNGYMAVHNNDFGKSIEREYGVKSFSFSRFIGPGMMGKREKIVIDTDSLLIFTHQLICDLKRRDHYISEAFNNIEKYGSTDGYIDDIRKELGL